MKKSDRDIMEILEAYDVALVGTVADHDTTLDPDNRSFRCSVRAQHSGAFHDFLDLHEFEFLAGVGTQLVRFPGPVPGDGCSWNSRFGGGSSYSPRNERQHRGPGAGTPCAAIPTDSPSRVSQRQVMV